MVTYVTVAPPRPGELHQAEGIGGVLRGVVHAFPLADDGRTEVVARGVGAVCLPHPATLAQRSVTGGVGTQGPISNHNRDKEFIEISWLCR